MLSNVVQCTNCGHCALQGLPDLADPLNHSPELLQALRVNDEPEPYLRDQILTTYISHEKGRLSIIQNVQSQLHAILQPFETLEAESLSRLQEYKNVVGAVRRLPTELLQRIFSYCESSSSEVNEHGASCSWMIQGVCRRWSSVCTLVREVNTANWSAEITPLSMQNDTFRTAISANFTPPDVVPKRKFYLKDIIKNRLVGSEKWKNLDLVADRVLLLAFDACRADLSMLETLSVANHQTGGVHIGLKLVTSFSRLPRLRVLKGDIDTLVSLPLPLSQVKQLEVVHYLDRGYSLQPGLNILFQRMDNLDTLVVRRAIEPQKQNRTVFCSLNIKRLFLEGKIWTLLPWLTLPALQTCSITPPHDLSEEDHSGRLLSFLLRCSSQIGGLQNLQLACNSYIANFTNVLQRLPSITYVDLQFTKRQHLSRLPALFAQIINKPDFLPRLQTMSIGTHRSIGTAALDFAQLLTARPQLHLRTYEYKIPSGTRIGDEKPDPFSAAAATSPFIIE